MKHANSLVAVGIFLAGCNNQNSEAPPIVKAKPELKGVDFDQVLLRIKQEVGLYKVQSQRWKNDPESDLARLKIKSLCGSGAINFNIKNVKMEFATTFTRKDNGEIGLKVPFGPPGTGSIGPDYKGSYQDKGTNKLDYTYYVPDIIVKADPDADAVVASSAVILPTLQALHDGLLKATAHYPCMSDTPDNKDDTFTFAVEVTEDTNPSVGFNFEILSASLGRDSSNVRANTITVTFHPTRTGSQLAARKGPPRTARSRRRHGRIP